MHGQSLRLYVTSLILTARRFSSGNSVLRRISPLRHGDTKVHKGFFVRLRDFVALWQDARSFINTQFPRLPRRLPFPSREIGELHRRASLCNRHLAERSRGAHGCRVVNIHIGRESLTHALHQPINHYEVHTAVTASLSSQLADVLPQHVLVFSPVPSK